MCVTFFFYTWNTSIGTAVNQKLVVWSMAPQRQYGVGSTRETSDSTSIWLGSTISQMKCWQWERTLWERLGDIELMAQYLLAGSRTINQFIHQSIGLSVCLSSRLFVCQSVSLSSALLNPRRHTTLISLEQHQLWSIKMTTAAKAIKSINEPIPTNQLIYTFHCIIGFETCASLNVGTAAISRVVHSFQ